MRVQGTSEERGGPGCAEGDSVVHGGGRQLCAVSVIVSVWATAPTREGTWLQEPAELRPCPQDVFSIRAEWTKSFTHELGSWGERLGFHGWTLHNRQWLCVCVQMCVHVYMCACTCGGRSCVCAKCRCVCAGGWFAECQTCVTGGGFAVGSLPSACWSCPFVFICCMSG